MNASFSVTPDEAMATCPACHTVDAAVTTGAVRAGIAWRCTQCAQRWDARRLAAVEAYAAWCEQQHTAEAHSMFALLDPAIGTPVTL
jgi:hypothetical protein